MGDHAGIDPIGLGEVSAGAGELADRPGGQDTDAVAGGGQGFGEAALITADASQATRWTTWPAS